jgi:CelD/BcsL family acetyltransferase involved in cellulose biosynthesis
MTAARVIDREGAPSVAPEEATTVAGELLEAAAWLRPDAERRSIERWRSYVESSSRGGVQLHPDVLLEPGARKPELSLVFDDPGGDDRDGSLALFCAKAVRIPALRPPVPGIVLRGHALLGGRLFGAESPEANRGLVARATELLAAGGADFFLFEEVEMESCLWREIVAATRPARVLVVLENEPHWMARFPPDPAEYVSRHLPRNGRRSLRNWDKTDLRLVRFTRPDEVARFVEQAAAVSARTWQFRRLGRGVRNDPPERALYDRVARLGALRSYVLLHREQPIAYAAGYQWNGHYGGSLMGYDPAFAELSPGNLMVWKIIEDLTTVDPVRVLDFGSGRHDYKARLGNEETRVATAYLSARALPWLLLRSERARRAVLDGARGRAKRVATAVGVWKWFRRRYRGA